MRGRFGNQINIVAQAVGFGEQDLCKVVILIDELAKH